MRALVRIGALALTVAAGAPHATATAQAPPEGIVVGRGADTMLGSGLGAIEVVTPAGEPIGDVGDTILSHDGRVVALVIGVGGLLGLAEKPVAVAWEHLSVRPTGDTFVIVCDLGRAVLDAAPAYREAR